MDKANPFAILKRIKSTSQVLFFLDRHHNLLIPMDLSTIEQVHAGQYMEVNALQHLAANELTIKKIVVDRKYFITLTKVDPESELLEILYG